MPIWGRLLLLWFSRALSPDVVLDLDGVARQRKSLLSDRWEVLSVPEKSGEQNCTISTGPCSRTWRKINRRTVTQNIRGIICGRAGDGPAKLQHLGAREHAHGWNFAARHSRLEHRLMVSNRAECWGQSSCPCRCHSRTSEQATLARKVELRIFEDETSYSGSRREASTSW